ncbi:hypothetical protein B4119_4022 [Parageobacillus caldoxylosilyticus]|uniref:Uncharacterized protein n=1 Tax=Saccharococcus caldoxylosilyticus TaxID=81408 RepID=A0A150M2P9_9BACL|nr:hypothetical protein B4119_4022 [Parageobacillus caldoxylosilyticus]
MNYLIAFNLFKEELKRAEEIYKSFNMNKNPVEIINDKS